LPADTPLYDLLKLFRVGRSHMALLTQPHPSCTNSSRASRNGSAFQPKLATVLEMELALPTAATPASRRKEAAEDEEPEPVNNERAALLGDAKQSHADVNRTPFQPAIEFQPVALTPDARQNSQGSERLARSTVSPRKSEEGGVSKQLAPRRSQKSVLLTLFGAKSAPEDPEAAALDTDPSVR
jgi:hypothetical protein